MVSGLILMASDETLKRNLAPRLEKEQIRVHSIPKVEEIEKTLSLHPDLSVAVFEIPSTSDPRWEILKKVRDFHPKFKLIVITAEKSNDFVLHAMKFGVYSLFIQPLDEAALVASVKHALRDAEAERYKRELLIELQARVQRAEGREEDRFWFVSKAKAMESVNEKLTVLRRESMKGNPEATILISGELGAGEEGIARMVYAASRRGRKSWLVLRCGSLRGESLEAELFGYEKGAFHGAIAQKRGALEIANGGTLLLVDIGAGTSAFQSKLNTYLQNGTFRRLGGTQDLHSDVRIIASSNLGLQAAVKAGKFREDLFRRLSAVSITLPALRERREDILPMALHFAREIFKTHNKPFAGFLPEAEKVLLDYSWPGNVQELYSVLSRASLISKSEGMLSVSDLGLGESMTAGNSASKDDAVPTLEEGLNYTALKKKWCDSFEKEFLKVSLQRNNGNVSAAAREAKLDRSNFLRLLRRHGLKAESFRKVSQYTPAPSGMQSEAA